MGQPPLGHEQTAALFAAWEAAHPAGAGGGAVAGRSGEQSGEQPNGPTGGGPPGHEGRPAAGPAPSSPAGAAPFSAAAGAHTSTTGPVTPAPPGEPFFTAAERNGTPLPARPRGKVLLAIGDAAEATDTLYPWMRLMEAGYECVVAAPEVRSYQLVLHERPEGWHITRETPGYTFDADVAFGDVRPEEYAGVLVSGGRAPEYIRYDQDLLALVRWMVAHGRPVGSVCHGIEVLATAGVIAGKRVTCVPKCQLDAEVCGATYVAAPVVVDGLLVTARGARDGWLWMREFLRALALAESGPAGVGPAQPAGAAAGPAR
jgi:protease I